MKIVYNKNTKKLIAITSEAPVKQGNSFYLINECLYPINESNYNCVDIDSTPEDINEKFNDYIFDGELKYIGEPEIEIGVENETEEAI
jgi:hypothetical protein